MNCSLKFKSAWITLQVTQVRVVFLCTYPFCELYNAFNGIFHKKLFAVFLLNQWEFLSDYLVTYVGQKSQQISDKKIQMPSEIKLLAGTNIYYCFLIQREIISKCTNFKMLPKTSYTPETKCLAVFLKCNRWPLK